MDLQDIRKIANAFAAGKENLIDPALALKEELKNVRIFENPLIEVAAADDPAFMDLLKPAAVGLHYALPHQWLKDAQSVVSFFFPFTQTIRDSNKVDMSYPSAGWLHGRIEGQEFIKAFAAHMVQRMVDNGYQAVAPAIDPRFFAQMGSDERNLHTCFTSNWSERHTAFICGLGTFSLSRGIITEKGIAGRFSSFITDLKLPPSGIHFDSLEANCIKCGQCIKNCPAHAISFEEGKKHPPCLQMLLKVKSENFPRLGCGKCQVNVPCEFQNPSKLIKH